MKTAERKEEERISREQNMLGHPVNAVLDKEWSFLLVTEHLHMLKVLRFVNPLNGLALHWPYF